MCKRILASQTNAEGGVPFYKIGTIGGIPDAYISKELFDEYKEKFANPYIAAGLGMIDDVIDPRDTRKSLSQALEMLYNKKEDRPKKKHGNIPL